MFFLPLKPAAFYAWGEWLFLYETEPRIVTLPHIINNMGEKNRKSMFSTFCLSCFLTPSEKAAFTLIPSVELSTGGTHREVEILESLAYSFQTLCNSWEPRASMFSLGKNDFILRSPFLCLKGPPFVAK